MSEPAKTGDLPPPYPGTETGQPPYPMAQQPPYPTGTPYPAGQPSPYSPPQPIVGQPMQTTTTTTVVGVQPRTVVVAGVGNCPNCRIGTLVEEFTCCGICLAIFFFPLGLICCLMMRRQVCTHCHAMY